MRTSLNEIKLIDEHLLKNGSAEDWVLFDAMLILNPMLKNDIILQKKAHQVVRLYSRKKLKAEIEAVHQQLFSAPAHQSFRQRILNFFSKND
jgi:hypothetical protein